MNAITTAICLTILLLVWTNRNGTKLRWYRGCGHEPNEVKS